MNMRASRIAPMVQPDGGIQLPPDVYVPATPPNIRRPRPGVGLEVGEDFEAFSQAYEWPIDNELTLFTTSRRWRACDVYIDQPNTAPSSCFTVRVYAILPGGQRTLIASGRLATVGIPLGPEWIVAARAVAARFEVTLTYASGVGGGVSGERVGITVIASDQAVEAPPLLGAICGGAFGNFITTANMPFPELVGVAGVTQAAGAARFMLLVEGSALPNGRVPRMVWPLGSGSGQGFADYALRYRTTNGFFNLCASSTANVCTLVADCWVSFFVR